MKTKIRVLSYNIHKGFSATNLRYILKKLKTSIEEVHADLVLLQEVVGHHETHRSRIKDWPTTPQFEYLADRLWPHYAYGKNAIYTEGHHGNAILSKFPIEFWENQDVSLSRLERRGILHAVTQVPGVSKPLHVLCVHLGLFENDRKAQVQKICQRISAMVPDDSSVIVGGDFNDWREKVSKELNHKLGLEEAFLKQYGEHARTFPSWLPVFRLDRLYSRGISPVSVELVNGSVWRDLSDHLPILAEFSL